MNKQNNKTTNAESVKIHTGKTDNKVMPRVSAETFAKTASCTGFTSAIEKQRADFDVGQANAEIMRRRQLTRRRAAERKIESSSPKTLPQQREKMLDQAKSAMRSVREISLKSKKSPRSEKSQQFEKSQRSEKRIKSEKIERTIKKPADKKTATTSQKPRAEHGVKQKMKDQGYIEQTPQSQASYLGLAPIDEGEFEPTVATARPDPGATTVVGYGLPSVARVNMGTYYAQPGRRRDEAANAALKQAQVSERLKKLRRKRNRVPRQIFYVVIIGALCGATVWQEIEYGMVGSFVSNVQAQGGVWLYIQNLRP